MSIQWYPGHMTMARRMMQEDIKLIDIEIELVDARLPLSSKNPDIDELAKNKARLILLNKADMADLRITKQWEEYYKAQGFYVLSLNSRTGNGMKPVTAMIMEACKEKIERDRRRGIKNRPIRAMIVGIPNVGKSTFINSFAGNACTKTGNKPGVTKGKQWIHLNKNVELLDTPGILWPKFDDQSVGQKLAISGSIRDDILNISEIALILADYLREYYPNTLATRYEVSEDKRGEELLAAIAIAKNRLLKGAQPDYDKAAAMLIEDFRSLRLGRISLEQPPVAEERQNCGE